MTKVGVFICHCGTNIAGVVDIDEVVKYASGLPCVTVCSDYKYMCSDQGAKLIQESISEHGLESIVVAACSPRIHEPTFRKVISTAGLNQYRVEIANIREHCSWTHMEEKEAATEKAKDLVRSAVAKAEKLEDLEVSKVPISQNALVIGAGIAGIQAALDLADQDIHVYLVEREGTIGGHMAQLDKTFPTLDCSSCILTPKMMDVSRHPNIDLLTYSEVTSVEGSMGNFRVKVKKHPRFVNIEKCTGCGKCSEVCRLKGRIKDQFNMGLNNRSAIYIPFPQAVPFKYLIDQEKCLMITKGKCGKSPPCVDECLAEAIEFDQQAQELDLDVGAVIVATGFKLMDPSKMAELGYGQSANVITTLELERLLSSSGPTTGEVRRPSDEGEVKSVSFFLCVGSRDEELNTQCCRIGCMSAIKHAYLLKEHYPDMEVNIVYTDIRSFGKGFEEFYRRIRGLSVNFVRGRPSEVSILPTGDVRFDVFDMMTNKLLEVTTDLVVLVPALEPQTDSPEVARLLRISVGAEGFFLEAHPKLRPMDTNTKGIFIAGTCQSPKDIPDTVAQASGAAARAATILSKDEIELDPMKSFVVDENCDGCAFCIEPCPYDALTLIEFMKGGDIKKTAEVTLTKCEGCGVCQATCPKEGIHVKGFRLDQLLAQVKAVVEAP